MRKFISLILTITATGLISCWDESIQQQDLSYKNDILNYLTELTSNPDEVERNKKIENLISSLTFKNTSIKKIRGNEELVIIDIKNLADFKEKGTLKVLFFVNKGEIVRSYIMVFSNEDVLHNKIIESFFNYNFKPKDYSGRISIYSAFQDILFFNEIESGDLISNGTINGNWNKNPGGKNNGCIDWYLVTNYYLVGGGRNTTEYYMFTTCDNDCNSTRIAGRVKCGGDGGGGGTPYNGGPSFPSYAQNGDVYEFRDQEGKLTRYRFNSDGNAWAVVYVILPEILIQSQPQTYPYLLTDSGPYHGLSVLGPDNLVYTFDAYLGGWLASPDVQNEIETPCLHDQVEAIRNSDVQSTIQAIFTEVFDNSVGTNMYVFTESSNSNYTARTFLEPTNTLQLRTDLNRSVLSNASLEYTTIVIYHEIVHAILYYKGITDDLHHPTILTEYTDQLVQSAISLFPNLPLQDARAIALFGLGSIANSNPTTYDQVAGQYGLTREQIFEIGTSYRRDDVQGNIKKGTPCAN